MADNKALSDIWHLLLLLHLHLLRLRSIIDFLIEVDLAKDAGLHQSHGHILLPLNGHLLLFAHGLVYIDPLSDLDRLVL